MTPYEPRSITFLELWQTGSWRIKVYGIASSRPEPRPELIVAARKIVERQLTSIPPGHYGIGVFGIHDGRTENFVFFDYWARENELHHIVWKSPLESPSDLKQPGPGAAIACVWDMRLQSFERDAWVQHVLRNPGTDDFHDYLQARLNEAS